MKKKQKHFKKSRLIQDSIIILFCQDNPILGQFIRKFVRQEAGLTGREWEHGIQLVRQTKYKIKIKLPHQNKRRINDFDDMSYASFVSICIKRMLG